MKICCISDTHTLHNQITKDIPECDLLIHSGDATARGTDKELDDFLAWLTTLEAPQKIVFVPGNHDFACRSRRHSLSKELYNTKVTLLNQNYITINGKKIYGTPWTPFFCNWEFNGIDDPNRSVSNITRKNPSLEEIYSYIPDDTNILVCHGPFYSILDKVGDRKVGSVSMKKIIDNKLRNSLELYICGHVHESYGTTVYKPPMGGSIKCINASSLNGNYVYTNPPIVIEF